MVYLSNLKEIIKADRKLRNNAVISERAGERHEHVTQHNAVQHELVKLK